MELKKYKRWPFILSLLAIFFLLILGVWWIYLLFELSRTVPQASEARRILNMLKWEGPFFILGLSTVLFFMVAYFIRDQKKSLALQRFFAGLTHELKTPLASIRLQGEVLADEINQAKLSTGQKTQINKYSERLRLDTAKLELLLDKTLQLARLEEDGPLNLAKLEINGLINSLIKDYPQLKVQVPTGKTMVMADEFALKIIIQNILENAKEHIKAANKEIIFHTESEGRYLALHYRDNGDRFTGESDKLGRLFYKHASPKGSGIGLYLIRRLMNKMHGSCYFNASQGMKIKLNFLRAEDEI